MALRFVDQEGLDDLNPSDRQQYFQKLDNKAAKYESQQLERSVNLNSDEYFENIDVPLANAKRSADAFREDQAQTQFLKGLSTNYFAEASPRSVPNAVENNPIQRALDASGLSFSDPRYQAYKAQLEGNSYQPPRTPSRRVIQYGETDFYKDYFPGL